ncbi:MAG: hypothetical protein AAGF91_08635, partial [Actinomycetota bacterium]
MTLGDGGAHDAAPGNGLEGAPAGAATFDADGALRVLDEPPNELLGGSVLEFLRALGGPTAFVQRGRHRNPRRVLVT